MQGNLRLCVVVGVPLVYRLSINCKRGLSLRKAYGKALQAMWHAQLRSSEVGTGQVYPWLGLKPSPHLMTSSACNNAGHMVMTLTPDFTYRLCTMVWTFRILVLVLAHTCILTHKHIFKEAPICTHPHMHMCVYRHEG